MKPTPILAVTLAGLAVANAAGDIPSAGLVAYYSFSGDANDAGPNLLHGTVYGATPAPDRYGRPNMAYTFDGANDYISLGGSALLRPTEQLTLALWASANWPSVTSYGAIAGNTHSGGYQLYANGGSRVLEGRVRRSGGYAMVTQALAGLTSGWHHFAVAYDGGIAQLYVDGAPIASSPSAASPIQYSYANHFLIGAEAGIGASPEGDYFAGSIDEVRIYNRALSASEIRTLYDIPDVPPDVCIEPAVFLSWEVVPGNYRVEAAPAAGGPWTPVDGTVLEAEGRYQMAVPARSDQLFFRLVRAEGL